MNAHAFPRASESCGLQAPACFPLAWPAGAPRSDTRARSGFRATLSLAVAELEDALRLFAIDTGIPVHDVVISSNVSLGVRRPADPGVAVWFEWDGARRCIAVDHHGRVAENVRGVFEILEARRRELAHAGLVAVRAAFAGFSVPSPPGR